MTTSRQPAPAFGQFIQTQPVGAGGVPFDPFGGFVQGINLGIGLENLEVARQQRAQMMFEAQKAEEQRRMVQDLQAQYMENPTMATLNAYAPYIDPQLTAQLRAIVESKGKDQARREFETFAPIAFAFQSGNKQAGLKEFDRIIEATQDPTARRVLEDQRRIAEINPQFFTAQAAAFAERSGLPEVAKSFLEKGKPEAGRFRVLTDEERNSMVPGATGVWGIDKEGKPTQIFAPQKGFTVVPSAEWAGLGITAEPSKVVVQRNNETGELKITNLGPLATATAEAKVGEKAQMALLKIDEDAVAQFVGNAGVASNFARDAAAIEQLLRGKGGGAVVSLTTRLKEFAGIQDDTVTAQTLARSLQTRGATQLRAPGSGSTTDFEMRAFLDSFPQLTQTENGRALLAKYSTRFAERQRKLADHARNLLKENKYSLQEMARFDNELGEILGDDIKELIGARRPVPRYQEPAVAPAPAPAAAPPPAARGQPAAAPQQRRNVIVNY